MKNVLLIAALLWVLGCATNYKSDTSVPAVDYANSIKAQVAATVGKTPPTVQYADQVNPATNSATRAALDPLRYQPYQGGSDYKQPLNLGNPGMDASLWRDDTGSDFYRDYRAWKPMDLVTILVSESSEGKKEADTETKTKSTLEASISSLLGLESTKALKAPGLDLDPGLKADTKNDFKGEGQTNRKDTLKGTISAMVMEVLPSGILRIEGKKIITVNAEEHVMVISGLVRPRDISSENSVDSSKIANLRVDYFGKGLVSERQNGGWLGRIVSTVWPF